MEIFIRNYSTFLTDFLGDDGGDFLLLLSIFAFLAAAFFSCFALFAFSNLYDIKANGTAIMDTAMRNITSPIIFV